MAEGNVTLVGYNSKKQAYIYLVVSVVVFITAVLSFFFLKGNKKYVSIIIALIAVGFLAVFFDLLKQPKIALKVFEDRYISFYDSKEEKRIDIHEVTKVFSGQRKQA